jgi:conjugative relaxase-like TrwC/TraI family protein
MLRVIVSANAAAAKSYYSQGLSKEDYYTKEKQQEIIGEWGGKGAELLGLKGTVDKEQFSALCDNLNPSTGDQLTARNNDNRRVGYDLNFHAPKSLSILYSLTDDDKILDVFRDSVRGTMSEIETDMQTRVRKDGQNENRDTGNLVYGEFIHKTARPVDGVPDPHLHAHCFTFNATYDEVESKWKAGEFGNIKKDASYYEACFHSSLSSKIQELGYGVERTEKGWEIAGIERSTIEKFSNRTKEVEEVAERKGITDARAKDQLGARTRDSKKSVTVSDLKKEWEGRLTADERQAIFKAKENGAGKKEKTLDAKEAVNLALDHSLERKSVAGEREVLRDALRRSYGFCTPKQVKDAYGLKGNQLIKAKSKEGTVLTTKEAVEEEKKLVKSATSGKGKFAPINKEYIVQNEQMNLEQRLAVKHALTSKDGVIIIEGGAGTGKTTLMKELTSGVEAAGKKVIAFAPSAEASRGVLQSEGFGSADTVARLMMDEKLQHSLKNNVLWIDEAGLLGNKAMNGVLEVAKQQNARVILTGDTRQHNSVERGDAMRILLEKSKIKPARVTEIQRQKSRADYKEAVKLISEDRHAEGFERLEKMGAVREIQDTTERHRELAREYAGEVKAKKTALVVAPTHAEGEQVTNRIREELKRTRLLAEKEMKFTVHKNLSPTEAQKKDATFYSEGHSIQFHQNAKGFARGSVYDVTGKDEKGNVLLSGVDGKTLHLPFKESSKFSVFEKKEIALAGGDKIRITQNSFSQNKKRLDNGNILTVKGFDDKGNIVAKSGISEVVLNKDHRNFAYGYCTTSHSSQGKTVDKVLIAQSSMSFGAASKEQFYVSVSRGKTGISIYTDHAGELRDAINRSSQRATATELERASKMQQSQQRLVSRLATLAKVHYDRAATFTQRIMKR